MRGSGRDQADRHCLRQAIRGGKVHHQSASHCCAPVAALFVTTVARDVTGHTTLVKKISMASFRRVSFSLAGRLVQIAARPRTMYTSPAVRNFSAPAGLVDVDGRRQHDGLEITQRCAQRIAKVKPNGFLRLRVDGGGCSGFKYKFELSDRLEPDDQVFERDGSKVVIDAVSLDMVRGAKVDFVEEMISSSFRIVENPKSDASCGCGASFAPKA